MAIERVSVTIPGGQRAGDATHFPPELEVVEIGAHPIFMRDSDENDPDGESDPEHPPGQTRFLTLGLHAGQKAIRSSAYTHPDSILNVSRRGHGSTWNLPAAD
jgi:hypothetical protein